MGPGATAVPDAALAKGEEGRPVGPGPDPEDSSTESVKGTLAPPEPAAAPTGVPAEPVGEPEPDPAEPVGEPDPGPAGEPEPELAGEPGAAEPVAADPPDPPELLAVGFGDVAGEATKSGRAIVGFVVDAVPELLADEPGEPGAIVVVPEPDRATVVELVPATVVGATDIVVGATGVETIVAIVVRAAVVTTVEGMVVGAIGACTVTIASEDIVCAPSPLVYTTCRL